MKQCSNGMHFPSCHLWIQQRLSHGRQSTWGHIGPGPSGQPNISRPADVWILRLYLHVFIIHQNSEVGRFRKSIWLLGVQFPDYTQNCFMHSLLRNNSRNHLNLDWISFAFHSHLPPSLSFIKLLLAFAHQTLSFFSFPPRLHLPNFLLFFLQNQAKKLRTHIFFFVGKFPFSFYFKIDLIYLLSG